MNKIFVIDGTDGSGKKTQMRLIKERLLKEGYQVASFPFPNYASLSSGPVRMYLEGELTDNPSDIPAKACSALYAIDRYVTFKKDMEKIYNDESTIILLDRYNSANLIHQGSKIIEKYGVDEEKLNEYIDWEYNFEFNELGIPRPTQTIFMNVPIEVVTKLIANRPDEITGNNKKDIHERNTKHLENSLTAGLYAANRLGWHIVHCMEDTTLRSIEQIHEEIYQVIKEAIS